MSHPIADLASLLARIGETLDLRAVLTEHYGVALESKGERWAGACPLPSTVETFSGTCSEQDAAEHVSDRPSHLWVSLGERTLVWRCHSCGRHGDVVDLIGYADGVPRRGVQVGLGAVRRAAELSGLAWIMDGATGPRPGRDSVSLDLALAEPLPVSLRTVATVDVDRAHALNAYVREIWAANLLDSDPAAEHARKVLSERGVSLAQARAQGIGFARRGSQIADKLLGLRDSPIELAHAIGLVKQRTDEQGNRRWFDAQRERLVFPYVELGPAPTYTKIVSGFAGRSLVDPLPTETPKWLNSATVAGLWSKKSALLGLVSALQLSVDDVRRRCVIVEGGLDVASLQRAEVPAVSPVGVDFTVQHATVLQRLGFVDLTLCFDGDEGGRKATPSAFAAMLAAGYQYDDLHAIDLADGLDPDDLSIDAMQRAYDCPLSIEECLLARADFFREHSHRVLPLLTYVPADVRARLCVALEIDPQRIRARPSIEADATPEQRVVRAILAHASACPFLAASDVEALLSSEPHLRASLSSVTFGEQTSEDRLPLALRRELARARFDRASSDRDANTSLSLWRYGPTIDDYRRAYDEQESHHERVRVAEKELARLDARA